VICVVTQYAAHGIVLEETEVQKRAFSGEWRNRFGKSTGSGRPLLGFCTFVGLT
jgi:hypothetical protein